MDWNVIQAPELLLRLQRRLGLRQAHTTPTLNEGVQAVIVMDDISSGPVPGGGEGIFTAAMKNSMTTGPVGAAAIGVPPTALVGVRILSVEFFMNNSLSGPGIEVPLYLRQANNWAAFTAAFSRAKAISRTVPYVLSEAEAGRNYDQTALWWANNWSTVLDQIPCWVDATNVIKGGFDYSSEGGWDIRPGNAVACVCEDINPGDIWVRWVWREVATGG